uniref:cysteine--tRNA ligase n=1 Tax=Araucaria cunninghamii TaxID=56994 RepID=A0A0D6QSM1_ARACU
MTMAENGSASGTGSMEESRGWIQPPAPRRGLRINNSLCSAKVPFHTSDGSDFVTWYICGPTVYDSSHVGHARNYVTFDILRRILEGFFKYHVQYVMNVTDVDDKIINKARRNYLLEQYLSTASDVKMVLNTLEIACEEECSKQEKKVKAAEKECDEATSRRKDELADKIRQEQLKLQKVQEQNAAIKGRADKALAVGGKAGIDLLIADGVGDVLASYLDAKDGSTVTDLAIFRAHAAKYEKEFLEDMQSLGVKPPTVLTRVTEYIDIIIAYVQKIIDQGFAYVAKGSVYFNTKSFQEAGHTYGKLNPWAVGSSELASESESNFDSGEKRNSCDFALWKASKRGEPYWESPWGQGRPGWHIECSAMASHVIGKSIDIHSGGVDLQFPHHDNELAQAEAFYGCSQWVNYFLHSGHLAIEGLKMSKSLKNFVTIRKALQKYTARQLRFLFVNQCWDKPMNFSESVMSEAIAKERQFQNFFKIVKNVLRRMEIDGETYVKGFENVQKWGAEEEELSCLLAVTTSQVRERLEDNFDTAGALHALLNLTSGVHSYVDKMATGNLLPILIKEAAEYVTQILVIFGLSTANVNNEIGFGLESASTSGGVESLVAPYINAACSLRDEVRAAAKDELSKERLISISDKFRDYTMVDLGVRVEDSPSGTIWELCDAETLKNEQNEKLRKTREATIKSLQSKINQKLKDLENFQIASISPKEYFLKEKTKYSAFDDRGLPTHDSEGKPLSKKAMKDVDKLMQKQEQRHEKYKEKLATEPLCIENLRSEVENLQKQLQELKASQQ